MCSGSKTLQKVVYKLVQYKLGKWTYLKSQYQLIFHVKQSICNFARRIICNRIER